VPKKKQKAKKKKRRPGDSASKVTPERRPGNARQTTKAHGTEEEGEQFDEGGESG